MLKSGEIIDFNKKKQFKYISPLGSGGTGDTHLFEDETTNILFAIKKYVPKDPKYTDEFYQRFVDEIKILFNLSHPNIVRIYNYYLYPEYKTGFLQMEYIKGTTIDKFEPLQFQTSWESIFTDTISAFRYLEGNKILHRDIRFNNILIDYNGKVKIIDFGFGKMLKSKDESCKSIFLNWPVTELPEEVSKDMIYNHQSEIYFLGKIFFDLLKDKLSSFRYTSILNKMIKISPSERYESFDKITYDILSGVLSEIDFSTQEKSDYQAFADALISHIVSYTNKFEPHDDINHTISSLEKLIRSSSLEEHIQNNQLLIDSFVNGQYTYNTNKNIKVSIVKNFYKLLINLEIEKQKLIMDNLNVRLSNIKIVVDFDDIPF